MRHFGKVVTSFTFLSLTALGGANAATTPLYGLIQTSSYNELLNYDLNQDILDGYDPSSLIPLNFTNILPPNSIVAIAVPDIEETTAPVPLPADGFLLIAAVSALGWFGSNRRRTVS